MWKVNTSPFNSEVWVPSSSSVSTTLTGCFAQLNGCSLRLEKSEDISTVRKDSFTYNSLSEDYSISDVSPKVPDDFLSEDNNIDIRKICEDLGITIKSKKKKNKKRLIVPKPLLPVSVNALKSIPVIDKSSSFLKEGHSYAINKVSVLTDGHYIYKSSEPIAFINL